MSVSSELLRRLQSVDKAEMVRRRLSADVHAVVTAVQTFSPFRCAELLPNGTVKVDGVKWVERHGNQRLVGTLYITATHVIFVDTGGKKEIWILLSHIASVDKLPSTAAGSTLHILCKNFHSLTFIIPRERDCHDVYLSLQQLSQPGLEDLYCFHYNSLDLGEKADGWSLIDVEADYKRMNIPADSWVVSDINTNYELCDTYPRTLYVPRSASKHILLGSARFRSRGRLPVLTYYRSHNQATLCRGSQPLAGFSARCEEDEKLMQSIRKANPGSAFMYVVDTRPKINAMMNRASGKGYENENFYTDIKFQFMGIENIHVMRSSLQKLLEVCELKNPSMSAFLSGLESSGWLNHIKAIIDTSAFIAKALVDGISVLAHCSDGWDRTAQTCALALVLIDPHYRTLDGFQVLVEKEWVLFGHKFIDRCGHVASVDVKEVSPIFTQFLDSVWQVSQQYPAAFEFNEQFLLTLHDHVHSCQFGTFVSNCEKDRVDLRLRERTFSLWTFVKKYRRQFVNPFYKEFMPSDGILSPNTQPHNIKFWCGMYCRHDNSVQPKESLEEAVSRIKCHTASLEDHVLWLTDRMSGLCRVLGKSDELLNRALQSLSSSDSMDFGKALLGNSVRRERVKSEGGKEENGGGGGEGKDDGVMSTSVTSIGDSSSLSGSVKGGKAEGVRLHAELQSVATHWASVKAAPLCLCGTAFDCQTSRIYCWRCGQAFCMRCISDEEMPLPAHQSKQLTPVCKNCRKLLLRAASTSSPFGDDLKSSMQQSSSSGNLS